MESYEVALLILGDIIENNIPFNIATKKHYQNEMVSREDRPLISGLVGCELRHHLLLMEVAKREFGLQGEFNALPVLLAIANYKFYKKFNQAKINTYACDKLDIDLKRFESFLNSLDSKEDLVPEEFDKGSFGYLSLKFNTPLWLVKLWVKHFGRGLAYKILKSNYHMPSYFYEYTDIDEERIFEDGDFFEKTNIKNLVKAKKGNAKHNHFVQNGKLFPIKSALKDVLNKTDIPAFSSVAIFCAYDNNLFLDICLNNPQSKVDIVVDNVSLYSDLKKKISLYGLRNAQIYEANASSLVTCISEKADTFFLMPNSSNFDAFRNVPDYFHSFSRDCLDGLIAEQRAALFEAKDLVNDGGQLIYMVPTLNKKESLQVIKDFLLENPLFSIIEQKQYFPFEDFECSLYFVKLIKLSRDND